MGADMGEYVVAITGDPKEPGGINGGIFISPPGAKKELNAYSCVVPTIGTFIRCKDTEGNIFTMLQPLPNSM